MTDTELLDALERAASYGRVTVERNAEELASVTASVAGMPITYFGRNVRGAVKIIADDMKAKEDN